MSASANPALPRRSFLGWTAAIAGCALLARPALAVPSATVDWTSESAMLPMGAHVIVTYADGRETRLPMHKAGGGWLSTVPLSRAGLIVAVEIVQPSPPSVKPIWVHLPRA